MTEYRVVYQYNKDHWTVIRRFHNIEELLAYILANKIELAEAIEQPDQCLYITQHCMGYHIASWRGDNISMLLRFFKHGIAWV